MSKTPFPPEPLYQRYRETRDPSLRHEIILKNLSLVLKVIRLYSSGGYLRDTLYSVGCIALIHAVDRYDPSLGVPFSAYARTVIQGEVKNHFRDHTWEVSVPRSLKEDYLRVLREEEKLVAKLGRSPRLQEIAQAVGLTEERVIEVIEVKRGRRGTSYDSVAETAEEDSAEPFQKVATQSLEEEILSKVDLQRVLQELPPREQLIVTLSHGHGMTQEEIAQRLGTSQVLVSRLLGQAVERLKKALTNS